jgi:hypothetical protein
MLMIMLSCSLDGFALGPASPVVVFEIRPESARIMSSPLATRFIEGSLGFPAMLSFGAGPVATGVESEGGREGGVGTKGTLVVGSGSTGVKSKGCFGELVETGGAGQTNE